MSKHPEHWRGLYPIVDVDALSRRGLDVVEFARALCEASVPVMQLRAKHASEAELVAWASRITPLARSSGVSFVVNDHPEVAARVGAPLVHVGQGDLSVREVRRQFPSLGVGVSTHSLAELHSALEMGPDYVAIGPIFATRSKQNPEPTVGLAGLAAAAQRVRSSRVPLVAIGGIDRARCAEVAGHATMVAVISALVPADGSTAPYEEVTAVARQLHAAVRAGAGA